jgi:hypothetical protein
MAFNPAGRFVRGGNFQADKIDGKYVEAVRFDMELDDIAEALSQMRSINVTPTVTFNPTLYYTKTQHDASLAKKQDALGFTPINEMQKGLPGGVVPLNANGQIDTQYLPTVYGSGSSGSGSGAVTSQTVAAALGYTPFSAQGVLPQAQVQGLPAALQAKQDNLGFTPANVAHTHIAGDIPGLQTQLDAMVTVSTTTTEMNTTFPKGHTILVQADKSGANYGVGSYKNALKPIYTGTAGSTADPGGYTTAAVGSVLVGQWLCRGTVGDVAIYERIA